MITDTTDINKDLVGWVLYDGECPMCRGLVHRFGGLLGRRGYHFVPLQADWVRKRLAMPEEELLGEMRVLTARGELFGGADAVINLMTEIWWAKPFALMARLPGGMAVLRAGYRWIAERRGCRQGQCALTPRHDWLRWAPMMAACCSVLALGRHLPAWQFMWGLSFAIFLGFKWRMFWKARGDGVTLRPGRMLAYFMWPGMDARAFGSTTVDFPTSAREWVSAFLKTLLGATLFWVVARRLPADQPLIAGWCGMLGLVFLLHFGSFHILSLAWRKLGIDAEPLMRAPVLATSLGDFWGNRWNLAFRQLGYELVFQPYRTLLGPGAATGLIFLLSGLIHELVISVPARGGYGLPLLYFVAQGLGVLIEKTAAGKRLGLGRGWRGRAFAVIVAAVPAFWLFHPPFVLNVFIPFMKAARALPGG